MAAKSMEHIAKTIGIAFDRYSGAVTFCSDTLTVCSLAPLLREYCVSLVLQYVATGLINQMALLMKIKSMK